MGRAAAVTAARPGIYQVGYVREHADGALYVTGWGIGLCAEQCPCHIDRDEDGPRLVLLQDQENGLLGLVSFADEGCDCCEPWSTEELVAVLDSFRQIKQMETTS